MDWMGIALTGLFTLVVLAYAKYSTDKAVRETEAWLEEAENQLAADKRHRTTCQCPE